MTYEFGTFGCQIFFLNSGNLICRSTGISMYFRESLGVRDNESRLYIAIVEMANFKTTGVWGKYTEGNF